MNIAIPILLGCVIFVFVFLIIYILRRCFFDRKDDATNEWSFDCFDWTILGIAAICGLVVAGILLPWSCRGKGREEYLMTTPPGMVSNLYSPTQSLGSPEARLTSPPTQPYGQGSFPTPPQIISSGPRASPPPPRSPDYSALIDQAAAGQ